MIYVMAANGADARQWADFNGYGGSEYRYLGSSRAVVGMRLTETDRIVRTALYPQNVDSPHIDIEWEISLMKAALTESVHGRLVRIEN